VVGYLSLSLLLLYVISVVGKYKVPHSLSATYYDIKHKWLFGGVLAASSALILPKLLSFSHQALVFISTAATMFVAFAPDFKDDKLTDEVHTGAAFTAFAAS